MSDDRISAAEIRSHGFDLGAELTDCATISRAGFAAVVAEAMSKATFRVDGDKIVMDISLTITEPFQWIDIKLTVSP